MSLAPIVLFVYNRPVHVKKTLESLCNCEKSQESELFMYCDGPKHPEDEKAVQEVRDIVKSRKWCGTVNIIEHDKNWGLAKSVINGVTEIINRYGKAIVLEDDLILSPQFLNFMNDALDIYKNDEEVMHISGYMFPVKGILPETFFYRATSCWGWATWKRAWEKFELSCDRLLAKFQNENRLKAFDIDGSTQYYKMLQDQATGKRDSWAIRWYASVFLNNGLCLHPGKSLVKNIGHDNSGIHCGSSNAFDVQPGRDRVSDFTQKIEENEDAINLMVDFYKSLKKPLFIRIANKLLHITGIKSIE
jgi:hypothetical protein